MTVIGDQGDRRFRAIQWRAVLDTPDTAEASKLLRRVAQILGQELVDEDVRKYRKDDTATEATDPFE